MAIVLGANRYGKAETRVFRVVRDTDRHVVRDLNVSTSLCGDFAAAHVDGDQAHVLPTDTQKNTVFAFAKKRGVGEVEEFGARPGPALRRRRGARDRRRGATSTSTPGSGSPTTTTRSAGPDPRCVRRGCRSARTAPGWSPASTTWRARSRPARSSPASRRRVHDAAPTHDRVLATSLTAVDAGAGRPSRTGTRRTPRSGRPCSTGSPTCTAGAAADPVGDGPGGARGAAGRASRCGWSAAQHPPRRRRPRPVRAGEPRRGVPRDRPALRADRGHRRARGPDGVPLADELADALAVKAEHPDAVPIRAAPTSWSSSTSTGAARPRCST